MCPVCHTQLRRQRLLDRLLLQHLLVAPRQFDMTNHKDRRDRGDSVERRVEDEHRPEPADVRAQDALRERGGDAEVREARGRRGRTRAEERRVIDDLSDSRGCEAERGHGVPERVVDDRRADREGEGAAEETDELSVLEGGLVRCAIRGTTARGTDVSYIPDGGDDRHVPSRYARLGGDGGGLQGLAIGLMSVSSNHGSAMYNSPLLLQFPPEACRIPAAPWT